MVGLVCLNVGGRPFTTTTETLLGPAAKGSVLADIVSAHNSLRSEYIDRLLNFANEGKPKLLASACCGHVVPGTALRGVFIDHDGDLFAYVLSYLGLCNNGELVPPGDIATTQSLLQEAKAYQIAGLVALLEKHVHQLHQRVASSAVTGNISVSHQLLKEAVFYQINGLKALVRHHVDMLESFCKTEVSVIGDRLVSALEQHHTSLLAKIDSTKQTLEQHHTSLLAKIDSTRQMLEQTWPASKKEKALKCFQSMDERLESIDDSLCDVLNAVHKVNEALRRMS